MASIFPEYLCCGYVPQYDSLVQPTGAQLTTVTACLNIHYLIPMTAVMIINNNKVFIKSLTQYGLKRITDK